VRLSAFLFYTRAQVKGRTALILAADQGHVDCARLLLDAGADKNVKTNVRRFDRMLLVSG
jgi:ankyrin repeat protein